MREFEPSLQQFGEFLLKAHLVRPNAAPATLGDGQVAMPGLLPSNRVAAL